MFTFFFYQTAFHLIIVVFNHTSYLPFFTAVSMEVFSFGCLKQTETNGLLFNLCYDRDENDLDKERFKLELRKYFGSVSVTNFKGRLCITDNAKYQFNSAPNVQISTQIMLLICFTSILTRIFS